MDVHLKEHDILIGNNRPFVFIGGPCVIESELHAMQTAEEIKEIGACLGIPVIYKSSFDKANRSSGNSYRGVGLFEGLKILKKVREEVGIPVISDIHYPEEAGPASEVLDILQIPAFLCRQTDLLVAAGETGKPVNIKKGQFMAPWDMNNAIEKVFDGGSTEVMLTERGTTFGYNTLVVDMASIYEMKRLDCPVIFDAGHSVQRPGGLGATSGGKRELIPVLARAAVAAGVAAVFLECHPDPVKAPCDGPNMWPMQHLEDLLRYLLSIDCIVKT